MACEFNLILFDAFWVYVKLIYWPLVLLFHLSSDTAYWPLFAVCAVRWLSEAVESKWTRQVAGSERNSLKLERSHISEPSQMNDSIRHCRIINYVLVRFAQTVQTSNRFSFACPFVLHCLIFNHASFCFLPHNLLTVTHVCEFASLYIWDVSWPSIITNELMIY